MTSILNLTTADAADLACLDPAALDAVDLVTISTTELAAWLREHGAAHVSPIERLELAERNNTRRRFLLGAGALALAGCSAPEAAAPAATSAGADYPRTDDDATGTAVTIPAPPQRILSLANLMDLDALLSLGVAPATFGIRSFISQYTGSPQLSWPWHEDALARLKATPARINGDQTSIETVAAAEPDLIVGLAYWLEESRDELASLAPVIQLVPNWRDNLRILAAALALEDRATQVVEATDHKIATALNGFRLDTPVMAIISSYDGATYNFFGHPSDGRVDLFQRAGFTMLRELAAQTSAETPVLQDQSIEVLDQLAPADVIVLFDYGDGSNPSGILNHPLFRQLPAVQVGRLVVLKQGELAQGLSTISPVNIDYCLALVRQAAELLV